MANPWQQFKEWRDHGGREPGQPYNYFSKESIQDRSLTLKSNWLTGERRAAYINHQIIGSLECMVVAGAFIGMALTGVTNLKAYIALAAAGVVIALVHLTVMVRRRETKVQLYMREKEAMKQLSTDNLQQLETFADGVQKEQAK